VRPPVANIDIAVIVTAVKEPNFTANLLDRQLVKVVHEYRQIGYPVIESTAPNAPAASNATNCRSSKLAYENRTHYTLFERLL
ncbi:hypothetical protein BMS83_09690, partial [Leuconostoc pseudomesenteroides]